MEDMKKESDFLELTVLNPVLASLYNVGVYKLWRNDEEKKVVLRHIYAMWEQHDYDINCIMNKFGISNEKASHLLEMYAVSYLGMTKEQWHMKKLGVALRKNNRANVTSNKIVGIYQALLEAKSAEEICQIIDKSGRTVSYLSSHLHDYLVVHDRGNYDEHRKLLINRLKIYSIVTNKKRKLEREKLEALRKQRILATNVLNATEEIEKFIASDCRTITEYVARYSVKCIDRLSPLKSLEKYKSLVEKYNMSLYQRFNEKIETENKRFFDLHINELLLIISLLKNNVIEDGVIRRFDILDYCLNTLLTFDEIKELARMAIANKTITPDDYVHLVRFITINDKYELEKENDVLTIFKETIRIGKDLQLITDDIKQRAIDYLRDNDIRVNYSTIWTVLRRYSAGYLTLEDSKKY